MKENQVIDFQKNGKEDLEKFISLKNVTSLLSNDI